MSRPCSAKGSLPATDCLHDYRFAENPRREAVVRIELSPAKAVAAIQVSMGEASFSALGRSRETARCVVVVPCSLPTTALQQLA